MRQVSEQSTSAGLLAALGVANLAPLTSPFDPGYDPSTIESHLSQSAHLMANLKLSMACWLIADESSTRRKIAAARQAGVPTVTGGGPFEIAVAHGQLEHYLDVCAGMGVTRIEAGQGFTDMDLDPEVVVAAAVSRGLEVQFELGRKHGGSFDAPGVAALITQGRQWLDAGASQLVIEAREHACSVGLFGDNGVLNGELADTLADTFGLDVLTFEAPDKASQFAFLDHFGQHVRLSNVRMEELLRVEIYRRGLHSDSFANPMLRPGFVP